MENKYNHHDHMMMQRLIRMTTDSVRLRAKYSSYVVIGKLQYVSLNDIAIMDYKVWIDTLKKCQFGWYNVTLYLSIDLSKITKVNVY